MVLGIQWLKELGEFSLDFTQMVMKFEVNITRKGVMPNKGRIVEKVVLYNFVFFKQYQLGN